MSNIFYNLARMYTNTTGDSDVTLGQAVPGCNTFALAGVSDSEDVEYGLITYSLSTRQPVGGETGLGKYISSGTVFKRTTVYSSTDSDNSQIDLTGQTQIYLMPTALFFNNSFTKAPVMWHDQSIKTVGGVLVTLTEGTQLFNTYTYQDSAADSDEWTNGFVCKPGIYEIKILSLDNNDRGKLDTYIDDVLIDTGEDFYTASPTVNALHNLGSFTLTGGYHTFKGKVNTKNASSSGYVIGITKIYLVPASY